MNKNLLSRPQIIRLSRLLFMKYKPSEIARILEVDVHVIYQNYLKNGCPLEKDNNGNLWIVGTEFREWAQREIAEGKKKIKPPMPDNHGYCFHCNKIVLMVAPKQVYCGGNREILQSTCPICGTKVNRARGIC